jgi:nicotinamide riboside transporter PnuC
LDADLLRSTSVIHEILRWAASVGTIGAGVVLAARVRPRTTGWAFVVLTGASIIWIVIGYLTAEYALMVQNVVVTLINLFGIYRWLIWKGKV